LTAGTSRRKRKALPSERTTLGPGGFAIGGGISPHRPSRGSSHSVPVERGLSLVKNGLAPMKCIYAVINLALVLIISVLAARKLGLPLCEINLDVLMHRPRSIKRTLRIIDLHLLTIEAHLMRVGDDLLQIENLLRPINAQLAISRSLINYPHSYGIAHQARPGARLDCGAMDTEHEDWLLAFLYEFASMSDEQRDAAIDALSPEHRSELISLADARSATAEADLIEILDAGQVGLEKLYELTEPADLFAVINLAVGEQPKIVVEALFAAVVLHRGWDKQKPAAILGLREGWHWRVHQRLETAAPAAEDRNTGA